MPPDEFIFTSETLVIKKTVMLINNYKSTIYEIKKNVRFLRCLIYFQLYPPIQT